MKFRGRYAFLSNFSPSPIVYNGKEFPTAEHAYQAAKTVSEEDFNMIHNSSTPVEAKRLGKKIKVRGDWNKVKLKIMREILEEKFSIEQLQNKLLSIEEKIVEENDWGDTYWGMCNGVGYNHLGKILMRIRDEKKYFS